MHRAGQPGRARRPAGTRPDVAGLRSRRRRRSEVQPRNHRPADQQRRRDVHPEVQDQGRVRIAVRHKPSGPFRVHGPAAGPGAGSAGLTRGDRQQHWSSHHRRHPLRRSSMGAQLQPVPRIRAVQACQSVVHLRTAAPVARNRHNRRGGASRRVEHRADAQPAASAPAADCTGPAVLPGRRYGCAADTAGGDRSRTSSAGSTSAPTVSPNSGGTPRSCRPIAPRTTSTPRNGSGPCRRN